MTLNKLFINEGVNIKQSIIVRKEKMNVFEWHRVELLDDFIDSIEDGSQTNENTAMAFFVKEDPITGEGEIYYKPAITSLNTDYLREMRDKLHFKLVILFGGGGIEG